MNPNNPFTAQAISQTGKRMVLTSVNQVIVLAKNNPELAEKLPKLKPLVDMQFSSAPKKACNCGGKTNFTTTDVNKQVTENLLSSLTQQDFLDIKNILGLSELCYYNRNHELNKLDMVCV